MNKTRKVTIKYNGEDLTVNVMPALIIDLDNAVRRSKSGSEDYNGTDDIELLPGIEKLLWSYRDMGYLILGVSNQPSVAFEKKTMDDVDKETQATIALFNKNPFHVIKICMFHPDGTHPIFGRESYWRMPNYGMIATNEQDAMQDGDMIDWKSSFFVGANHYGAECAKNVKMSFIDIKDFIKEAAEMPA